jgi:hypothetical protein
MYTTTIRGPGGLPDQRAGGGQVEQARGVVVRRERHERDRDPLDGDAGDLAGQAGLDQAGRMNGPNGLGLARGTEVVEVVVGVVQHGEARLLEVTRVRRRGPEGEAVRARRAPALAGRGRGERAFQVAEDDLGTVPELRPHRPEVRARIRREIRRVAEHHVADGGEGHRGAGRRLPRQRGRPLRRGARQGGGRAARAGRVSGGRGGRAAGRAPEGAGGHDQREDQTDKRQEPAAPHAT